MRHRGIGRWTIAADAAAGMLCAASPASAAVTIGSDLASPASSGFINCFLPPTCTALTTQHPVNPVVSPIDGVIVRWRTRFGEAFAGAKLRVLSVSGNAITGIRSGPPTTVLTGSQELPINPGLPIAAGELVGVDLPNDMNAMVIHDRPMASSIWRPGAVADGATSPGQAISSNIEVQINADIEPDCDADGFGDETQDPLVDCVIPETQIIKGPKDKTRKKRATFEFSSNEAGATFECSLDGGAFAPCTSPDTLKVKRGKHSFQVRARDAGDNADASPASDEWNVKRRKRR